MKKQRLAGAGALALAFLATSLFPAMALTNGVILITSRTASDALYRQISSSTLYDADDYKGPGVFSPGDVGMAILLQDHGYTVRLLPEWLLRPDCIDPYGTYTGLNPEYYYGGGGGPTRPTDTNADYRAQLVIVSGSGSSFDMPPPNTNGIAIMMGEVSCIGNVIRNGHSSIYMYGGALSAGDVSSDVFPPANPDVLYMKVVNPDHPIMQGIPLDAQGRVKIWRDPYPEENAHLPASGPPKKNWRYSWLTVNITSGTVVPAGTTILGLLASDTNRAVFAVTEAGAEIAPVDNDPEHPWFGRTNAPARLVHFFVNERGSGDSRRAFNNLTDIAKVIFIRACKWAMGEDLQPYQPLGLIRVSQVGTSQIRLAWDGTATKNYKILGTTDLLAPMVSWQTVVEDIVGVNGEVAVTLDISGGPQYAFLRVMPVP